MRLQRWIDNGRRILDERYHVVVIALIVLITFATGLTYATYAAVPPEERIESSSEFEHGATVEGEPPVFENGSQLEDRRVYFPNASPELDGEFLYSHDVNGDSDLTVETQILVRMEEFNQNEEEIVWQDTQLVTSEQTELGPDETQEVSFTVDIADRYNQIQEIQAQLGNEWDPRMIVIAETQVSGTVDGQSVEKGETHRLPMEVGELRYRVGEDEASSAGARGPLLSPVGLIMVMRGLGMSLLVVSIVALAALVIARQQGTLTPPVRDPALTQFDQHRDLYDEWISKGVLPDEYLDKSRIQVPTLEELVNVAYDSDSRVINDVERNAYYVVAGDAVYEFVPPNRGDPDAKELPPAEEDSTPAIEEDIDRTDREE